MIVILISKFYDYINMLFKYRVKHPHAGVPILRSCKTSSSFYQTSILEHPCEDVSPYVKH
jgi:hypothetical protein